MAIINNNVKNVKFLRNQNPFESREDARQALVDNKGIAEDGTSLLARYTVSGEVKTIVGYVAVVGETHHLTIIDVEGASSDVEELRKEINAKLGEGITSDNTATEQLAALSGSSSDASGVTSVWGAKAYADDLISTLDYTDTVVTGSYVSAVNEADGRISVTRVALPDASSVSGDNKVVTDVTQSKGAITATASNITSIKLAGYAEGTDADIAATDTLGQALGKLQAQINAMDKDASAVDGQVVTTVSEADGKITEAKANVKDLQLGGYVKNTSATGGIASTDTLNEALSKLENKAAAITITNADGSINVATATSGTDINVNINSGEHVLAKDGAAGLYTNIALSSITPSSTTVREEYQLTATDGTKLGDTIKIYKDSSISKIYLGYSTDTVDEDSGVITSGTTGEAQSLNYVYHKEDGKYEMVHVDVSKFLVESEFASGVTADATGIVHGVVDTDSETNSGGTAFLTVGADGFKVSGIKQEIIDRINELDADLSGNTTHVKVGVAEADGKITAVTVDETDIASASALAAEIAARKAVDGQDGQTYAANAGKTYISGATSLNDADIKLNDALKVLSDNTVNEVQVNGTALAESNNVVNIQISATNGTGAASTPLIVNTNDGTGAVTIQLEGLDCGTY